MVDPSYTSPTYSSSLQHSETHSSEAHPGSVDATVISARFSNHNLLTVHLVADKLLSDCWTKACEFARNFNATHIDIDHLLLGASHVRDAEAALSAACDDIEELTHELARVCARRSFAQVPDDNMAYEASQSLRIILCEASALAARQDVPNLTLSLVIEALAHTEPRPAVLEVLPKLRRRIEEENAQEAEALVLLNAVNSKVDGLNAMFDAQLRTTLSMFENQIGQAIAANIAPMEERLQQSMEQSVEEVAQLTRQRSDATNRVYEAVQVLPNMIATAVGERVAARDEPKDGEQDQSRRWFHFW